MANKFTRFLTGVANGLVGGGRGLPSTYQHATRLFIDDTFRLSPRTKFNYYVRFEIDPSAHKALSFTQRDVQDIGLLVKNLQLPSYSFETVTKNQYNRKKIVYKMLNYDPITLRFHDDSHGVTNALWAIYYGYYAVDRSLPDAAYSDNKYTPADAEYNLSWRYGLDNQISVPFFKKIHFYTMSRSRFLGYSLVNPRITKWSHSDMDYSISSEPAENTMTLEYEAVQYSGGRVSVDNPTGFATLHYDNLPSSLSVIGGGVSSLTGTGGVLDGLETVFGAIQDGSAFDSPEGALSTAIGAMNTYNNLQGLSAGDIAGEAINILQNPNNAAELANTIGGIADSVFPGARQAAETKAVEKKITDIDQSGRVRGGL